MNELMLALMVWLSPITGLPVPDELPHVKMADACEIERLFHDDGAYKCGGDIQVVALYMDGRATMYLRDTWSPTNLYDVSVLLHELVHHMQAQDGKTMSTAECPGQEIELPAYQAQIAFLEAAGVDPWKTMGINELSLYFFTECERLY